MENSNPALIETACKNKPRVVETPECETKTQNFEADAAASSVIWQSASRQDTRVWVPKEKADKLDSPRF